MRTVAKRGMREATKRRMQLLQHATLFSCSSLPERDNHRPHPDVAIRNRMLVLGYLAIFVFANSMSRNFDTSDGHPSQIC